MEVRCIFSGSITNIFACIIIIILLTIITICLYTILVGISNVSKNTAKQDSIMEVQVVTYITYKKNKETRRPVCQIERGAIQPGGQVSAYQLIP